MLSATLSSTSPPMASSSKDGAKAAKKVAENRGTKRALADGSCASAASLKSPAATKKSMTTALLEKAENVDSQEGLRRSGRESRSVERYVPPPWANDEAESAELEIQRIRGGGEV